MTNAPEVSKTKPVAAPTRSSWPNHVSVGPPCPLQKLAAKRGALLELVTGLEVGRREAAWLRAYEADAQRYKVRWGGGAARAGAALRQAGEQEGGRWYPEQAGGRQTVAFLDRGQRGERPGSCRQKLALVPLEPVVYHTKSDMYPHTS